MGGGGGGGSGPTLQQQQLETAQALTTANLNLEENAQRKSILNAMSGTRVFRGSALSRAVAGNNDVGPPAGAPSKAQMTAGAASPTVTTSLLDTRNGKTSTGPQTGNQASLAASEAGASAMANASGIKAAYFAANR